MLACGFCVLVPVALSAGDPAPATGTGEEADHQALRAIRDAYQEAVNGNKLELLTPFLDPEFTGVMVTGEEVAGLKGLKDYWTKIQNLMGPGGKYAVKVNPDRSLILGDVALAKGTTEDRVTTDAGDYAFGSAWTTVARKVNGQWKVLRVQGSMDPIGNPFVLAILKRASLPTAFAGGALGLAAGGILGYLLGKRRRRPV